MQTKQNNLPKFLYALFYEGHRIDTGQYAQLFFDRKTARAWKVKAASNKKYSSPLAIGRVAVAHHWEMVR